MKGLVVLSAIVAIVCLSSQNWRRSIYIVFFMIVLEGILRKWVLPQASDLIYFIKDLVLIGAYLKYFLLSKNETKVVINNSFLKTLLLLSGGWCLFQSFNPSLGSSIIGLFGLRGYFFYVPLMWMFTSLFRSEEELYQFLRIHLLLLIPVGILGVIQFLSPASSLINVYAGGEAANAGFSGTDKIRITGTFSYIAGYVTFLTVCFSLLLPVLSRKQSLIWQWLATLELILLVANSFMTGSRSVVLSIVLFAVAYIGLSSLKDVSVIIIYLKRLTVPVVLAFVAGATWFRSAFDAFALRANSSDSLTERILNGFEVTQFFTYKQLDGYGTGATHQAGKALRNALDLPVGELIPIGFESEMGRIALELGPFGFVLWYGLRISLVIALGLVFFKLKDPFLRQLALAAFLTHLIQISGQLVVNHTLLVYYWFFASFIFLLPHLEKVKGYQKQQQYFTKYHAPTLYFPNSINS